MCKPIYNPALPQITPSVSLSTGVLTSTICIGRRVLVTTNVEASAMYRMRRIVIFPVTWNRRDQVAGHLLSSADDVVLETKTVDMVLFTQSREYTEELHEQRELDEGSAHDCRTIRVEGLNFSEIPCRQSAFFYSVSVCIRWHQARKKLCLSRVSRRDTIIAIHL